MQESTRAASAGAAEEILANRLFLTDLVIVKSKTMTTAGKTMTIVGKTMTIVGKTMTRTGKQKLYEDRCVYLVAPGARVLTRTAAAKEIPAQL